MSAVILFILSFPMMKSLPHQKTGLSPQKKSVLQGLNQFIQNIDLCRSILSAGAQVKTTLVGLQLVDIFRAGN